MIRNQSGIPNFMFFRLLRIKLVALKLKTLQFTYLTVRKSHVLTEASFNSWDNYHFVLRKEDGWIYSSQRTLSREIQDAFQFQVYQDDQTGKEYLISIPISQIPADQADLIGSFWIVSLLEILEPPKSLIVTMLDGT